MTGYTTNIVIAIQPKILRVIECRRQPFFLSVALRAIAGNLLVQRVCGQLMTALTLFSRFLFQQMMIEMSLFLGSLNTGMITVAGYTILINEFLVKGDRYSSLSDGFSCCCQTTDFGWFVAYSTTLCGCPSQWFVTGKTIGLQVLVPGNQFSGFNHQVGVGKNQNRNGHQVSGKNKLKVSAHTQPQNRKMLKI
jgi:hypothetical protein